jgi:hypothetical protein
MRREITRLGGLLVAVFTIVSSGSMHYRTTSADEPGDQQQQVQLDKIKPKWRVGDQWVIETTTLQLQTGDEEERRKPGATLRWRYTVAAVEKLAGNECFRIGIQCQIEGRPQPATTIWVEKDSLALRQMQTQLPVPGGFRTVTESYQFPAGQASPVITPLTALPIDLPRFLPGQAKGTQTFQYEAVSGPAGTKALGELGFAFDVQQTATIATAEGVKGLLHEGFAKDLAASPIVSLQITTSDREVTQLWRANLPWAAYTDNGTTTSRLVEVIPAKDNN